MTRFMFSLFH